MLRIFYSLFALSIPLLLLQGCGGGGGGGVSVPADVSAVTLVNNAAFPVAAVTTPTGNIFYAELFTGRIRKLRGTIVDPRPLITLEVAGGGNEGLLGLALDPEYSTNGYLYTYRTVSRPTRNQVLRLKVINDTQVTEQRVILDGIPSGGHDGGKMVFDATGHLLISTGDGDRPELSPDMNSLGGKILRISRDGVVPVDNPFGETTIYARGLRNPFGMARSPFTGTVYISDNGPACDDEVNILSPAADYGWRPGYPCGGSIPPYVAPEVSFTPPISPTGMIVYSGDLFPELRGQLLMGDFLSGGVTVFGTGGPNGTIDGIAALTNVGESVVGVSQGVNGKILVLTPTRIIELTR